jgi:PPM family protein phosphatase
MRNGNTRQEVGKGGVASDSPDRESRRHIVVRSDHACAITDVGRVRSQNEDRCYISPDGRLMIVADGMGGHASGEVASSLAVEVLADFFDSGCESSIASRGVAMEDALVEAFTAAHIRIAKLAEADGACRGMGTTLILGHVDRNRLYTCHVGDVRAYLWNGSDLQQITQDHSVVGIMTRAGQITHDEARVHPWRNEVLQAVGVSRIAPEIHSVALAAGNRVLLCSDGLWEELGDDEIRAILSSDETMRQLAIQLVDRCVAAGGRDNITAVLYEHVTE